ncbi:MAG: class I SAM-dependent methyltransferase [Candidatus Altiarchaeota archaeon]|nr:class I SAM-dependent methyltransferase [Candidatus Altiarchaeota archaeon]
MGEFDKEEWAYALPLVKGNRVLDIGCGRGKLLARLKSSGMEVYGIELDPDRVKECVEKGLNVVQGDIEKYNTKNLGQFDTIAMTSLIEHLENPLAVLNKVKANLKPDGRLVLLTPNVNWFLWHIYGLLGKTPFAWISPDHTQFWDYTTFRCFLEKAGYEITENNSIGKIPWTSHYFKVPLSCLAFDIIIVVKLKKT